MIVRGFIRIVSIACAAFLFGCGSGKAKPPPLTFRTPARVTAPAARYVTCRRVLSGNEGTELFARYVAERVEALSRGRYKPEWPLARRLAVEGCRHARGGQAAFIPTLESVGFALKVPLHTIAAWVREERRSGA